MQFSDLGCACYGLVFWLIIWGILSLWVFKDAEEQDMNHILWAVIVFLFGIIGLVVYLVVRSDKRYKSRSDDYADSRGQVGSRYCLKCGSKVLAEYSYCQTCGNTDFRY